MSGRPARAALASARESDSESERDERWSVSLAFWATLLVAGALFASVSLAPRLRTLAELQEEFATNQHRLVALERRADELEEVARALKHDPHFAAELSKVEFSALRPGDERITLPPELHLGANHERARDVSPPPVPAPALPRFLIKPLATHSGLRAVLLAASALLVLAAFLLLHDEQLAALRALLSRGSTVSEGVARRYRKP